MNTLNRQQRRAARTYLKQTNRTVPVGWHIVPRDEWPNGDKTPPFRVWRNRDFLVQLFREKNEIVRLTINRTSLQTNGQWNENITWEELQAIKNRIGYSNRTAVEIYPSEKDEVRVANMRHLWVLSGPLDYGWKS